MPHSLCVLDAKQDSRKQNPTNALSDATLPVLKTLLFAVCIKETAKPHLFLFLCSAFCDGCIFRTGTGSKNATNPKLKAPKPAQAQTNATKSKAQMHCQRSDLDWPRCVHCLHLFEPVPVSKLEALDFLSHAVEPVQVLELWVVKICTGS